MCKKPDVDTLFERLRTLRGRMPPDFKFNRDEANACGGGAREDEGYREMACDKTREAEALESCNALSGRCVA